MIKQRIIIREYARLTTANVLPTLDLAQLPFSAFDWLCRLSASFNRNGAPLLQVEDRSTLKWDSYVGVLQSPCGTQIEILPKVHDTEAEASKTRRLLCK